MAGIVLMLRGANAREVVDEVKKKVDAIHRDLIPAGRMCTAEEVARFVSVLAREETHWLNGATIDFTGGMMLRLLDVVLQPDSSHLQHGKRPSS